jgi:hypothetical protein
MAFSKAAGLLIIRTLRPDLQITGWVLPNQNMAVKIHFKDSATATAERIMPYANTQDPIFKES